jgi:RHS repeat-associated protein
MGGTEGVGNCLRLQGQYVGATAYFYTCDHLGSIREMFTGGGTVVARYDYDPYGRSTTVLGTTPTDYNFTGLFPHSKSNLDLAVYRAYDPDLGRWLNRDPSGERGGLNLYDYVSNNPLLYKDLDGRQGVLAVPEGIAVAGGAVLLACYLYPPCREALVNLVREACLARPREKPKKCRYWCDKSGPVEIDEWIPGAGCPKTIKWNGPFGIEHCEYRRGPY